MHWLLVLSAVLMSWLAAGWITQNVIVWLVKSGRMPALGPKAQAQVNRILLMERAMNVRPSPGRRRPESN